MIAPFKGREVDAARPVRVYRNLHAADPARAYSVQQGGLVVGHADRVMLRDARFVVSAAGATRARRIGRKVVYAFVEGTLATSGMGLDAEGNGRLPVTVRLDRRRDVFVSAEHPKRPLRSARCVLINQHGCTAAYTEHL